MSENEMESPGIISEMADTMLSPVFVGATVLWAVSGYNGCGNGKMPWELAYLALPMCLHRKTRETLPRTSRTHLVNWAIEHPVEIATLTEIAPRFATHVRSGLRACLRSRQLWMVDDGCLAAKSIDRIQLSLDGEVKEILSSAATLGKIFSKTGSSRNVFATLGVLP